MSRRYHHPWQEYPGVHERLEDWADWIRSEAHSALGWHGYRGYPEFGLRVQNGVHSDRVYGEISRMDGASRRALETQQAWQSLPRLWRHLIWLRYVAGVDTGQALACRTGIARREVSTHLRHALGEMDILLIDKGCISAAKDDRR